MGRLQAHSFSYSGNPQGCDHAVRHLHTVLEAVQAKLSRQTPSNANISESDRLVARHAGWSGPASSARSPAARCPSILARSFRSAFTRPRRIGHARPVIPLTPLEPR